MKTIYIVLTRSNTVISRLVYMLTGEAYTHISLSFDSNLQLLYSSGRKNGRTLIPAGPCTESFESALFKYQKDKIPCALYELHVNDEVYTRIRKELDMFMRNSKQYHYNFLGLFLCKLHIKSHRKNYFFCSQFVGEILSRSVAIKLPKDASLMHPCDYMELPELQCNFKGSLGELLKYKEYHMDEGYEISEYQYSILNEIEG